MFKISCFLNVLKKKKSFLVVMWMEMMTLTGTFHVIILPKLWEYYFWMFSKLSQTNKMFLCLKNIINHKIKITLKLFQTWVPFFVCVSCSSKDVTERERSAGNYRRSLLLRFRRISTLLNMCLCLLSIGPSWFSTFTRMKTMMKSE